MSFFTVLRNGWLASLASLALAALAALPLPARAGTASTLAYPDEKTLESQLRELAKAHAKTVHLFPVCESLRKQTIWRLELGTGNEEERHPRPALLAIAGLEGNDLAGTVSLLAWARALAAGFATDDKIRALLESTTIHIWPRLNPDATRQFFAKPRRETSVNEQPFDDDHDGLTDEDGPDDLDEDGMITWMRVEDPAGEYLLDPVDPRLLLKADRLKGERGKWKLLVEGRDNDGDKRWNEDGLGGVNFNRNFPYRYKFFADDSGRHQISEVETRALADFIVGHPSIAVVFAYGAADNLTTTPKGEAPKRPPTGLHEEDVPWMRELGKAWREALGLKKELPGASEPGTFADWIYFHRGRLGLAAKPWSPAEQLELAKAAGKEGSAKEPKTPEGTAKEEPAQAEKPKEAPKEAKAEKPAGESDNRNEEDRAFLKWLDAHAPNAFVPWKRFEHSDFPGQNVELGGFAPFARSNPPADLLGRLAETHGRFLTALAGKLPRIGVRKIEAKHLGEFVYDITVQIENTGYLPTQLAQGALSREVLPTRVVLKTEPKNLLSGIRTVSLSTLQGGESKDVRWVVRAKAEKSLELDVISALGGSVRTNIALPAGGGQ